MRLLVLFTLAAVFINYSEADALINPTNPEATLQAVIDLVNDGDINSDDVYTLVEFKNTVQSICRYAYLDKLFNGLRGERKNVTSAKMIALYNRAATIYDEDSTNVYITEAFDAYREGTKGDI